MAICQVLLFSAGTLHAQEGAAKVQAPPGDSAFTMTAQQNIHLPGASGRMGRLGYDSKRGRLYVTATTSNQVYVVDVHENKLVHTMRLASPFAVAYLAELDLVAISNSSGRAIHVLNAETYEEQAPIQGIADPQSMLYDEKAKRLYVSMKRKFVAVIDMETRSVLKEVDVGGSVQGFALDRANNQLFVSVIIPASVACVDLEKLEIVRRFEFADSPANGAIAFDGGQRLFLITRRPARFVVLNANDGSEVASHHILSDCDGMFFDSAYVFLSCGSGVADVFEQVAPDEYRLAARLPTAESARTSLLVPEVKKFFVSSGGSRSGDVAGLRVFQYQLPASR